MRRTWLVGLPCFVLYGVLASGCRKEGDVVSEGAAAPPASAPASSTGASARVETLKHEARALTDAFAGALKQELLGGLSSGGPSAAVSICSVEAAKIAERTPRQANKPGWTIGRTSSKVRNPKNAPNAWQKRGLSAFARQIEASADLNVGGLEWHEVHDGRLRYMRAIPTGGVCITCHGAEDALDADLKKKLAELYPDDRATGFAVGDLRGAFVVTAPL